MRVRLGTFLIAPTLFAAAFLGPVLSQETIAIDAIILNQDSAATKIAVPVPGGATDAAPEIGMADNAPGGTIFNRLTEEQEDNIVNRAYPLMAAKWPFNTVFVCWEETPEIFIDQRALVRDAIQDTWDVASGLQFLGWGQCSENSGGIRISVQDRGPHVKFLGKFLEGLSEGMVLNFTYQNWSTSCQQRKDYCTRVIAVHEFGHAIGFAHEQNRPDTPGECDRRQGTDGDVLLTPWDKYSVMNYCNPIYGNDGVLSEFDTVAVQYIYGGN